MWHHLQTHHQYTEKHDSNYTNFTNYNTLHIHQYKLNKTPVNCSERHTLTMYTKHWRHKTSHTIQYGGKANTNTNKGNVEKQRAHTCEQLHRWKLPRIKVTSYTMHHKLNLILNRLKKLKFTTLIEWLMMAGWSTAQQSRIHNQTNTVNVKTKHPSTCRYNQTH